MSSDADQADRSQEEKAHLVDDSLTTVGALHSPQRVSVQSQTQVTKPDTLASTLADDTVLDKASDTSSNEMEKSEAIRTYNLRGRQRLKSASVDGVRSRSVSQTWNNRRVTFTLKDKAKFKSGICRTARFKVVFCCSLQVL